MITNFDGALVVMPPVATATNTTTSFSFSKLMADGQPADFAVIDIINSTHSTAAAALEKLAVVEHDSTTSATSMTSIAALLGTTDATSALTLPAATVTGLGAITEFQVDLRNRKKYIGVLIHGASGTATVGSVVRLVKTKTSKDTAALKSKTGATYGNLASTAAIGCAAVYTG
jgi:hypothetical protein